MGLWDTYLARLAGERGTGGEGERDNTYTSNIADSNECNGFLASKRANFSLWMHQFSVLS